MSFIYDKWFRVRGLFKDLGILGACFFGQTVLRRDSWSRLSATPSTASRSASVAVWNLTMARDDASWRS